MGRNILNQIFAFKPFLGEKPGLITVGAITNISGSNLLCNLYSSCNIQSRANPFFSASRTVLNASSGIHPFRLSINIASRHFAERRKMNEGCISNSANQSLAESRIPGDERHSWESPGLWLAKSQTCFLRSRILFSKLAYDGIVLLECSVLLPSFLLQPYCQIKNSKMFHLQISRTNGLVDSLFNLTSSSLLLSP